MMNAERFFSRNSYRRVSHERSSMATEDAKVQLDGHRYPGLWHCVLESKSLVVLVEFSSLCFERHLISFTLSALRKMTLLNWQRFSLGCPSAVEIVDGPSDDWRSNPFLPTSSTGVDVSFFFHEDSCWSASKTLFAECPK